MGVTVVSIPSDVPDRVDLAEIMTTLAQLECNEVLIEAGSRLSGALIAAGLVDELVMYLAPSLLGHHARDMFQLPEFTRLDQKVAMRITDLRMIGQDIRLLARLSMDGD